MFYSSYKIQFSVNTGRLLSFPLIKFLYFLEFFKDERFMYGVDDRVNEGTWVCEGTGQIIATATGPGTGGPLFQNTQPDNLGGQDCAFGKRQFEDFLLRDASCTLSGYYLCEKT